MKKGANSDLVFHRNGEIVNYMAVQKTYNRAFQRANLPFSATHILRHTFATLFLDKTNDVYALKEIMDHSDLKTTMVYAKILKKKADQAWKTFEAASGFNLGEKSPCKGSDLTPRGTFDRPHLELVK